ncbi:restriction endonuclease subunit S [Seminibacterium arietis]|uniref:Restriction endonuclease subunit S n=1 Tax=Seminibacterium arietis TaxID=1173502 RepID=A0ABW3I6D9_9PAST
MGSVKSYEKRKRGRKLKKIDASLNEKLAKVQWGEYRIGDLFESQNGDFDIQKKHINNKGVNVITAGLTDSGILGKSDIKAKIFKKNTITIDMFGNVFFRNFEYKMVTHARVFSLEFKFNITEKLGLFISNTFTHLNKNFGYENMCSWNKIQDKFIQLPTKNGQIDFEFMESFVAELEAQRVAELEAQRVAELEAYLVASDLKDYTLTDKEKYALNSLDEIEWGEYRIGDLFEKISTKKLPYKANDLPKEPKGEYILPALTSSFMNQGLNYYVPIKNATILKNVISLPSNSDVYRAYYQSKEFTVLSDSYAIKWLGGNKDLQPKEYLFFVPCINQVTDLKIYSYKNKLGGWNKVKNKTINLPTKNGQIDFEFMETFIKAIQKLIIADVVKWTDKKIAKTKEVIDTSCSVQA